MAYQLDDVRRMLRQRGIRGCRPWQGESSTESEHRSAIEFYVLALQLPDAMDTRYIHEQMKQHVMGLLGITPMQDRERVLRELSDQCGVDYLVDEDIAHKYWR